MLPHELAKRHGNMLSVNQEIPEDLVDSGKAVLCPLLAGQMSVSDESVLCRLAKDRSSDTGSYHTKRQKLLSSWLHTLQYYVSLCT